MKRFWLLVTALITIVCPQTFASPTITSLSPSSGVPGTSITISGSGFTSTQGTVTFNGSSASISSWSDGTIVAIAPSGVTNGNVVVTAGGISSNGVFFYSPTTGSSHVRPIVIDHRMVSNTDQTDFPVLISGTFPYLATVANGGEVQSSSGYDIVFSSDAAGQNKLDHEIDSYNATTGSASFWLRIPTLSHTTDTAIYMWYGNSAVTASQENKPGVWRNGYAGVWHFSNNGGLSASDSTGNNTATISNVTAGSGQIGGAGNFSSGSTSYVRVASSSSFKPASAITLEAWAYPRTVGSQDYGQILSLGYRTDTTWNSPWVAYNLALHNTAFNLDFDATTAATYHPVTTTAVLAQDSWTHVVAVYDGSAERVYLNGLADTATQSVSGAIDYGSSGDLTIGTRSATTPWNGWDGLLDEVRISTVARSADWIATEYTNQKLPGTYVISCPETASGSQPSACSPSISPSTFSNSQQITFKHALVPNSDQTDFPALISDTFSYLATVANGGNVQSSNGWDIVFTSDAAGQNKLDHEIESYNGSTGQVNIWVRIPTLSHTTDTTIYMWYGNSSVQVSQEYKPGVWRHGYGGVWHLATMAGNTVSTLDSTGNNTGTLTSVSAQAGHVDGAGSLNGNSYVRVANSNSFKPAAALTLEAWVNPSSVTAWNKAIGLDYRANGSWSSPYLAYALQMNNNTQGLAFQVTNSGNINNLNSVSTIPLNNWSHLAATFDSSSHLQTLYVNGNKDSSMTNNSSAIDYGTSQDLTLGQRSPYSTGEGWNGLLDELRISTVARSADWIATEYNNQSSPQTFYYLGQSSSPTITSISPSSGEPGSSITIGGNNFTSTQGSVSLNGQNINVSSWSEARIVAVVPNGASSGNMVVTAGGQQSNAVSFSVLGPTIASLSPNSGEPASSFTISGSNFGNTAGAVTVNGQPASVSQWSDSSIRVTVPNGATNGNVVVSNGGLQSNGVAFTVLVPTISSLSPNSGPAGAQVTISGSNFEASGGTVTFNGQSATISSWSDGAILAVVPPGALGGNVVVNNGGLQSNGVAFTVIGGAFPGPINYSYDELGRLVGAAASSGDAVRYSYDAVGNILAINRYTASQPALFAFEPNSGAVGTQVTIQGANFSANSSQDTVTFNGPAATITSASATQLVASVPAGATTGPITVTAPAGSVTSSTGFTVQASSGVPTITGFTPGIVTAAGQTVTITGTNFDTAAQNDRLILNSSPVSAPANPPPTSTSLTMTVPSATASGHISLSNPAGVTVSAGDLYVYPPWLNSSQSPASLLQRISLNTATSVTVPNGSNGAIGLLLFDGTEGQWIAIDTSGVSGSYFLEVAEPNYVLLPGLGSGCTTPCYFGSHQLPRTGTYTVVVEDGGTYTLWVTTPYTAAIPTNGTGLNLNLLPGQSARLNFNGTTGQSANVQISNNVINNTVTLSLINPDGSTLNSVTQGNTSFGFTNTLPQTGSYTVVVDPGGSASGSMTVSATVH